MDERNEPLKLWSNTQAYIFAVICLLLGVLVGYLVHPPKAAVAKVAPAPAAAGAMGAAPTVEQLKRMADKKAEPLLAALQKQPNDAALLTKVAETYLVAQQFQTAETYYERAASSQPDPKTLTQLANSYYYGGDADKAIAVLDRALQVDPKYPDALFNLGMIQWRARADPKAAIATWEKLLKTNPRHPKRAQVEEAIARAKQHLNIAPGTKTDKPAL